MKRSAITLSVACSAALLLFGCPDNSIPGGGSDDASTNTIFEIGGGGDTAFDVGRDSDDDSSGGDTDDDDLADGELDGGDGGDDDDSSLDGNDDSDDTGSDASDDAACDGLFCGRPAICCPDGYDCISGQCQPPCPSGVRCGDGGVVCCESGQLCLADSCASIGASCLDSYDCPEGSFCEPLLERCLVQPEPLSCQIIPEFEEVETFEEWTWTEEQVISIPVIVDLDGDDLPEVIVNATRVEGISDWQAGSIIVLDGRTGLEERRILHLPDAEVPSFGSHGRSTIAAGDVSGDGIPDIIYAARPDADDLGTIVAVAHDGQLLWQSWNDDGLVTFEVENAAVTLTNFDDDPEAEIVIGAAVLDHNGYVVWNEDSDGPNFGSNNNYRGGISAIADLNRAGLPEIISGADAWTVSWADNGDDPPTVALTPIWPGTDHPDGYPAVADFDGDGWPEVVLVAERTVRILDGRTGELWCGRDPSGTLCDTPGSETQPFLLPGEAGSNRGGPPTIADFDGDGRPEIGIAGGYAYTVYDINRPDEVVVQPDDQPAPDDGAIFIRWTDATRDLSSNATGSSVFDFQGDGAAEVIYADECYIRVYDGASGDIQLELESSSATIHEYPLVVDVDGDNNSEIVIVANATSAGGNCAIDGYTPRQGIFVYGDPNDDWVRTRRVWPQHTYHVTNATSDGNVPETEDNNWETSGLNNYRQNVQGEGVFNAPDLVVDFAVGVLCKEEPDVILTARISNQGSLGVAAGVMVQFYQGTDASGTLLGTQTTEVDLFPGESTELTLVLPAETVPTDYYVVVDGVGSVVECETDNNSAGVEDIATCGG